MTYTRTSDRWPPSRKREIVEAIAKGDLAMTDAMRLHDLAFDELQSWITRWTLFGEDGLKTTRCQALRPQGLEQISGPLSRALADTSFAPSPNVPAPKGQTSDLPHASRGGADASGGGQ